MFQIISHAYSILDIFCVEIQAYRQWVCLSLISKGPSSVCMWVGGTDCQSLTHRWSRTILVVKLVFFLRNHSLRINYHSVCCVCARAHARILLCALVCVQLTISLTVSHCMHSLEVSPWWDEIPTPSAKIQVSIQAKQPTFSKISHRQRTMKIVSAWVNDIMVTLNGRPKKSITFRTTLICASKESLMSDIFSYYISIRLM